MNAYSHSIASNPITPITRALSHRTLNSNYFAWILRGGICLIIILSFIHLILLNSLATQGFDLQELKTDRVFIQKSLEKWDIALTIPVSLYALGASEQVQQMADITEKNYMQIINGQVAFSKEHPKSL